MKFTNSNEKVKNWKNLKYGMFIHFGLSSLCGGIWDGKKITKGYCEQILSHGNVPQADYEALMDKFETPNFNADEIAKLALDAGMSYIVLVTKHHDGFCLFDTKTTDYSSMNAACHKDFVAEISQACKKVGLKFGVYFSWIDWHYPYAEPISPHNSDIIPKKHMELNINQITELLTNYGEICELWLDMGHPTVEQSEQIRDLAHSLQPNIMVNGRIWNDCGDFLTMGDNEYPEVKLDMPWQTPATIYHETWGYRAWQVRDDLQGKIDTISSSLYSVINGGGNYLLNIGPMGDGSVVPFEADVLRGIGKIVKERGLERKPVVDNTNVVKIDKETILSDGELKFRYTGSEYYTYHAIATSLEWSIDVEKEGVYEISWIAPARLAHEDKLCIEYGDSEIYFTLKCNDLSAVITTKAKLPLGISKINIHTVGPKLSRPELKQQRIKLCIKEV